MIWQHFFASFLSRDEAFKLIADGWSQQGNGSEEMLDRQVLLYLTFIIVNNQYVVENCNYVCVVLGLCLVSFIY